MSGAGDLDLDMACAKYPLVAQMRAEIEAAAAQLERDYPRLRKLFAQAKTVEQFEALQARAERIFARRVRQIRARYVAAVQPAGRA